MDRIKVNKPLPVVLGLHIGHDATACLAVEGTVLAAVGEERLSRTKQHYGFPFKAIAAVLEQAGVAPSEVDCIALGGGDALDFNPWQVRHIYNPCENGEIDFSNQVPASVGRQACLGALRIAATKVLGLSDHRPAIARKALEDSLRACGLDPTRAKVVDHHLAHAVSAYATSMFDQSLGITIDGYGDGVNTAIWACQPTAIKCLAYGPKADDAGAFSPGDFYSYVTRYLGFKRNRHEGKITGLAAYAPPSDYYDSIKDLLTVDSESACFTSSISAFRYTRERRPHVIFRRLIRWAISGKLWDPLLMDELGRRCTGASPAQVAAAAQQLVEDRIVALATFWVQKTRMSRVCLAGGVFANVKLNQRIAEIDGVNEVFIHPNMGDGGLSLGAAIWKSQEPVLGKVELKRHVLKDVYLGPEFEREYMRRTLEVAGASFSEESAIEERIAEAVHQGKVVARFDGRMEYGPRALGNRSILAAPTDPDINDWLNKRLQRTEFMPFAPAVLADCAADIFDNFHMDQALKFMTITLDVKPEWRQRIPAVCHIDGTARPQLLDPINTPSFHKIVSCYKKLSGLPVLINTSFNMHEEPIVCTPEDALRAFEMGHLDFLAMGPFWVANQ